MLHRPQYAPSWGYRKDICPDKTRTNWQTSQINLSAAVIINQAAQELHDDQNYDQVDDTAKPTCTTKETATASRWRFPAGIAVKRSWESVHDGSSFSTFFLFPPMN